MNQARVIAPFCPSRVRHLLPEQRPDVLLVGPRVFLRGIRQEDAEEFIALNRASRALHRGWASPPITQEEFKAYCARARVMTNLCSFICLRDTGAIAGTINLGQIFRGPLQNAYVGYLIGQPFAGRGYMGEALRLMLRVAFRSLRLHRLEANIQPANAPSIALVQRAGFTKEGFSRRYLKVCGRYRDHERWAILREDWNVHQR